MPIEILELVVRARVQQNSPDTASQTAQTQGQSNQGNATAASGAQQAGMDQLQPTIEEVIIDVLKRRNER